MTKRKKITDPKIIFRIYCREYRQLSPQVLIPQTLAQRIDVFVENIINGRAITPFSKAELSTFGPTPGSVECSIYFIEYLRQMSIAMEEQQRFTVSPTRACKLLYNLSADEIYTPQIMRLESSDGRDRLKSFERYDGSKLVLWLEEARECYDWTLTDAEPWQGGLRLVAVEERRGTKRG